MTNKINRSGTSQDDKLLTALQPEYVSVEERSITDLLKYARDYAQKVRFYNETNQPSGFWVSFLNFSDNELLELAELAENPALFSEDPQRFSKYSKPHLALLLTFLKLLHYPQSQFAELTAKNIEFFYRTVLRLEERPEVPDQVHVVFALAQDIREYLLKKGTRLNAGIDTTGVNLQYEVTEDIVLNNARVSDIKTIHFNKVITDMKYVHVSNDKGDIGFEKILCLALGDIPTLPPYTTNLGETIPVDAVYLRTELYQRIKGKEKDELDENDADYIFNSLCFRFLKDFVYCLDLLYREMNRGYAGISFPEDSEWDKAYTILNEVHYEGIARTRRTELKEIHKKSGFESMMEYAFGEPDPGNMLYKMPGSINSLEELVKANNEAARKYIENRLCMTPADLRIILDKQDIALTSAAGEEIYALLETAWTKKRGYQYPEIGTEKIEGYYADNVFSTNTDDTIGRFQPFGKPATALASTPVQMGFIINSPLLRLNEGARQIEIVVSCQEGTIEYDRVTALLAQNRNLFSTYLSSASGWQKADDVNFEIGDFIIKPERKTYTPENSFPVCSTRDYSFFDNTSVGKYLVFTNGSVYQIVRFDDENNRILLQSVGLQYSTNTVRIIEKLIPRWFVGELKTELNLSKFADRVVSPIETFNANYQNKYLVDRNGRIFFIRKFVSANEIAIKYCGDITTADQDTQLITINKVWELIEPQYREIDERNDLSVLAISGIDSDEQYFSFEVTDGVLKIFYPEGATAEELLEAWEAWKDIPDNYPGRYEIVPSGTAGWQLLPAVKELEKTGEILKRYESIADNGIKVNFVGRPADPAYLTIGSPSNTKDDAEFVVFGGTLTITPGLVSQTANQIAADWRLWTKDGTNDPKGFKLISKDEHIWDAAPVMEASLIAIDKQIKSCDLCNLYGVGIRVWYTGLISDEPKLILKENTIDLFEFDIHENKKLTIKYPSSTPTSAHDLAEAWMDWKMSELNNPGTFEIEELGDGLWTIQASTEKELQPSENQIIECTIDQAGIIARFKLTDDYRNAIIEFIGDPHASGFSFVFSDLNDANHNQLKTKKMTITYPPLPVISDNSIQADYQIKHVQALLSKWNREYKKYGFSLIRKEDNAKWAKDHFTEPLTVNFMDSFNYVCTVDPDGFVVKYKPVALSSDSFFKEQPKAKIVLHDNDCNAYSFSIANDYVNNIKTLFIKYPTDKKNRSVEKLLKSWKNEDGSLLQKDSLYWKADGELKEFLLEQSGTGKWELTSATEQSLTAEATADTEFTSPIRRRFFEYQTDDVNGFTVCYGGPISSIPKITIEENTEAIFELEVAFFHDEFHGVFLGESLKIKYPNRVDKRRIVDLLVAWKNYKKNIIRQADHILGFEIRDTSRIIEKRFPSELLVTGDIVRKYNAGSRDGIYITYIGHRNDPTVEFQPILDFSDSDIGKTIVWDNGELFTVTGKVDKNNVTVEPKTRNIQCSQSIKLYEKDAICLDALKFTIQLSEEFPPVVPLADDVFTAYPAVKILLNNQAADNQEGSTAVFYEYFKSVYMKRIDMAVAVNGLKDLRLRGNLAMINPNNPFNPLGLTPDIPAKFYFANREICEKKLDQVRLNFNWSENEYLTAAGLPDMGKYYYAYSHCGLDRTGTIKNEDFEVSMQFLNRRTWIPISQFPQGLFQKVLSYNDFNSQTYEGAIFPENEVLPKDPLDWPRYYKLELSNQDFMQEFYREVTNVVARASNNLAAFQNNYNTIKQEIKATNEQLKAAKIAEAEARDKGESFSPPIIPAARELPVLPENDLDITKLSLNLPYTPSLFNMSIDYTASTYLLFDSAGNSIPEIPVRFFRLHPFGYEEMDGLNETDDFLLPQFNQEGYLFLGIDNLGPLQTVSLLIQMISGSGDVNLSLPEIAWSYLVANRWVPFKASEILKDLTYGLQDTGIIRFSIPAEATTSNTILPNNRCWLRAEVKHNITAFPDILDIRAGAICVTYRNQNNDPHHLDKPLVSGIIKELAERNPSVKGIQQPYTSFNGKPRENASAFYIRVSERLKHKNRALTADDYEKLILTQFPQVYRVKCVPQDELELFAPANRGEIIIIVILKNANSAPFFPLQPKTPANILAEIKRYIQAYMPPLVKVTVRNPRFEEIKYRLAVKFNQGYDQGYYINILNEDIKRFLSPWAYDNRAEISLGSSIYSSSLINYIENTDYVDYVANFSLLQQIIAHENYTEVIPLFLTEDNAATAKYPDSILVSAENHIIDVITTESYDAGAFRGIGHMQIAADFWISRPGPVFSVGLGEMELETRAVLRYGFTDIPVTVKITATIANQNYTKTFETKFTAEDSQQIWGTLIESGYIDGRGSVVTEKNLYAEDFQLVVGKDGRTFEDYLGTTVSSFSFQLHLLASDFDPTLSEQADFTYNINEIQNAKEISDNVVEILKNGLGFDGESQYPFIVY